jgi:hypothetical protein
MEQFGQTAAVRDGFGEFEQGLPARSGRFAGGSPGGEAWLERPRARRNCFCEECMFFVDS